MVIYLSGPMAGCTSEEMHGWRNKAKRLFSSVEVGKGVPYPECLDPTERDYSQEDVKECYREIVVLDKRDIRCSDVLLVNWMPGKSMTGTAMEIQYAHSVDKPIVVVLPEGAPVSPWVLYHATKIVKTLDEGVAWITEKLM